jgi:hypothetical protein
MDFISNIRSDKKVAINSNGTICDQNGKTNIGIRNPDWVIGVANWLFYGKGSTIWCDGDILVDDVCDEHIANIYPKGEGIEVVRIPKSNIGDTKNFLQNRYLSVRVLSDKLIINRKIELEVSLKDPINDICLCGNIILWFTDKLISIRSADHNLGVIMHPTKILHVGSTGAEIIIISESCCDKTSININVINKQFQETKVCSIKRPQAVSFGNGFVLFQYHNKITCLEANKFTTPFRGKFKLPQSRTRWR